jgi:hypothetical protein
LVDVKVKCVKMKGEESFDENKMLEFWWI